MRQDLSSHFCLFYDLIWASVCVQDTMIFERYVVSNKNKNIFCVVMSSQECFLLSQSIPPQICNIYIHDIYVDWNIPSNRYRPKCYYDHFFILFASMHPTRAFSIWITTANLNSCEYGLK